MNSKGSQGRDSMLTQKPGAMMKSNQRYFPGMNEDRQYIPVRSRRKATRNKTKLTPLHNSIEAKPSQKIVDPKIKMSKRRQSREKEMAFAYHGSEITLEHPRVISQSNFIAERILRKGQGQEFFDTSKITCEKEYTLS